MVETDGRNNRYTKHCLSTLHNTISSPLHLRQHPPHPGLLGQEVEEGPGHALADILRLWRGELPLDTPLLHLSLLEGGEDDRPGLSGHWLHLPHHLVSR